MVKPRMTWLGYDKLQYTICHPCLSGMDRDRGASGTEDFVNGDAIEMRKKDSKHIKVFEEFSRRTDFRTLLIK